MDLQTALRRRIITFSSIVAAALSILLLSKVVRWRAGILARFHTNNAPVVVSPPANFSRRFHLDSGFPYLPEASPNRGGWLSPPMGMCLWPTLQLERWWC
jgi:hypothetical protein